MMSNSQLQQIPPSPPQPPSAPSHKYSNSCNVFQLLAQREVCPRNKHTSKKLWGETSTYDADSDRVKCEAATDARQGLISWVEAHSIRHLSAKYCTLFPTPRSTIAAAFGPDGKMLASTHGDHTVKIIDWPTGKCLKVLSGHRRTPWVVRFHPLYPEILASGSLDQEVCLWDTSSAQCIMSRDFYRPIASIAFHAEGNFLAVAAGHKLYIWHYNRKGDPTSPTVVLKTRRSLRAVHFHPHAAPFLLTAEVNSLDLSDSSMAVATSLGYSRSAPRTVYLADGNSSYQSNSAEVLPVMSLPFLIWPSIARDDSRISLQQTTGNGDMDSGQQRIDPSASVRLLTYSTASGEYELLLSPIEASGSSIQEEPRTDALTREMETTVSHPEMFEMEIDEPDQFFPFSDPAYWDLPLLQRWLLGQSQAAQRTMLSENGTNNLSNTNNVEHPASIQSVTASNVANPRGTRRSGLSQSYLQTRAIPSTGSGPSGSGAPLSSTAHNVNEFQPFISRIQSEIANSLAAAGAAELPCTVKLRIWQHDVKDPCAPLDGKKCRLTIPHAVLCSEMGTHFSPCGRFLAACVACISPNMEGDRGFYGLAHQDAAGTGTSPTRHPISAHQVIYELRIYSLEEATFGCVLASRAIRAAHCLTSIQFSPTSEHLLIAYGRRHNSLLESVVIDGEKTIPVYTVLEVYRGSDMELVRVLASAEDEVNVACFHPSVGNGLVYGTKEGKLRILQYDNSDPRFMMKRC